MLWNKVDLPHYSYYDVMDMGWLLLCLACHYFEVRNYIITCLAGSSQNNLPVGE